MTGRLGVFTFPYASPVLGPLTDGLARTLDAAGIDFHLVARHGERAHQRPWLAMPALGGRWRLLRALAWGALYPAAQVEAAIRVARHDGPCLFYVGPHFHMAALVGRLAGKRVLYVPGGRVDRQAGRLRRRLAGVAQSAMARLAHTIGTESGEEASDWPVAKVTPLALRHLAVPPAETLLLPSLRGRNVLYLGRLEPGKGFPRFLDAIPRMDAEAITIAGQGSLLRRAQGLAASDARVQVTGWVTEEAKRALLERARLVVLPAVAEGVPTVMLEAMAHLAPVLAAPVGGVPAFLRHGETGCSVGGGSLAQAVGQALDDPRADAMALRAHAQVAQRCGAHEAGARWRSLVAGA